MKTTTSVLVERFVECPFAVTEDYAADYLRRAEAGGPESIVRASIFGSAAIVPRRKVAVTFGLRRDAGNAERSHDEISIFWDARSWMFPNFNGSIRFEVSSRGTRLILSGSYQPPFGLTGRIFDDLFGRHIAAATMRDYLERLAIDLETRDAGYRSKPPTSNGSARRGVGSLL